MPPKTIWTRFLILFVLSCFLPGISGAEAGSEKREERILRTLEIGPKGELSLSNIFGDVHVEGIAGEKVTVEAVKRGARVLFDSVEVDITHTGRRVRIETRYLHGNRDDHRHEDGRHGRGVSVDYKVSVPAGTEIELQTVRGDVTVRKVTGRTRVSSVQGHVRVYDAGALDRATSVSGDVTLERVRSKDDVEVKSVSGEVLIEDIEARELSVSSVSGDVRLVQASCEEGEFATVSGDIHYTGQIMKDGHYEFKAHSGDIVISVGDSVGFELEASTFSGDIESQFPLKVEGGGRSSRNVEAVVGDGSAVVEATTFSGDIEIRKH